MRQTVPKLVKINEDVKAKLLELPFSLEDEGLPVPPDDELFAIVAYTHDLHLGKKDGNLYYELNKSLRQRGAAERQAMMNTWGGFVHYMMKGLALLPDIERVCYRGYPDKEKAVKFYRKGRPIQWGAFSSCTVSFEVRRKKSLHFSFLLFFFSI